jgi:hypothetical protein
MTRNGSEAAEGKRVLNAPRRAGLKQVAAGKQRAELIDARAMAWHAPQRARDRVEGRKIGAKSLQRERARHDAGLQGRAQRIDRQRGQPDALRSWR